MCTEIGMERDTETVQLSNIQILADTDVSHVSLLSFNLVNYNQFYDNRCQREYM